MDSINSQNSERSEKKKSKAKQAEDAGKQNSLVGSKLAFGEEIAKMFGLAFERQVALLFQSFKDKSFHVDKKFVSENARHEEKCQVIINFLQNKIKQVKQQIHQERGDNLVNSSKQEEIQNNYCQIFTDNKSLNMFVQVLAPDPKNLNEDFDLMIEGACKYELIHNRIIENLTQKSAEHENIIWVIENYLGINLKENQWTKVIFEMKRTLFTEMTINEGNNAKNSQQQIKAQFTIQKIMENFRKQNNQEFIKYLEKSALIRTLTQIMKLAFAGKFYNLKEFTEKFKYFGKNSSFKLKDQDKPNIDLYLIIDNNKKEEEFRNNFDFFKPLLRHWFEKVGARLHVIGYNKKPQLEYSLEQKIQKLQFNKNIDEKFTFLYEQIKKLKYEIEKLQNKQKKEQQLKKISDEQKQKQEQIQRQKKIQKKRQKNKKKRQKKKKKEKNEIEKTETKTEKNKQQLNQ